MAKKATKQSKYDWKRWSALQLVSWLPQNQRDAFEILDQAREFITHLPKARKISQSRRRT